jgi:16S rRNA (cytosine1402-N4)-methyltransferase
LQEAAELVTGSESNQASLETRHVPVLLAEVLQWLAPEPGGSYVDATAGGGGHSAALLEASHPHGRVLSLDADPAAVDRVRRRLQAYGRRSTVVQANFRDLDTVCHQYGFQHVDGILLDLGLSSDQLADADRGFALMEQGPLDMRFNPKIPTTAADLVNSLSEAALADLIYRYGEETFARRIARAIVSNRPFYTSDRLAAVIARTLGRRGRLHPATKTFQALRIAVNDELGALEEALPKALAVLRPAGRLVVISFHSLEDRIVKQFMQREAKDCICPPEVLYCTCGHRASLRVLTRKPVKPSEDETARNPRSRSARLRAAERLPLV